MEPPERRRLWRSLAGALVLGATAVHLAYVGWLSPHDLAPDEAHYWDWSRQLDWCYYSKGPLVAWLIRASCALTGPLAASLPCGEAFAVRLPAVLCAGLLLVSLYVLTVQSGGQERTALLVVVSALTVPAVSATTLLMTIDAPFTCCWGWALVLAQRAVFRPAWWAWPAAGLAIALGLLAKFTMGLFVPLLALFLVTSPPHRPLLRRPGFWALTATAALGAVPIVAWNARNGWVSFLHVEGQAGLTEETGVRWLGPLQYVAEQGLVVLLGAWFVAWVAALFAHRPWREPDARLSYLWFLSAPVFLFFGLFTFRTPGQLNWPAAAYLAGLVLAVVGLERRPVANRFDRALHRGLVAAGAVGLTVTVLMHDTRPARPVMLRLAGPAGDGRPTPLRRIDPTCRLRGWRTLAAAVDGRRAELRARGEEPVLAAVNWPWPGELSFYCAGRPTAYCLGLANGDRWCQYDLWRPNPVWDPELFRGRTFLVVGEVNEAVALGFERVGRAETVWHVENGQPVAQWYLTVCRGFRGFPILPGVELGRY
jgi:4-amino-4-deoxy-L-arabinose transferase-like glycosyltransferase